MTYYTQSYSSVANGGAVLQAQMNTWLTANHYVLVDTVTSGTQVSKVYKSPAAYNFFGQDWYLITYTADQTTSSTLQYGICQAYNATTHKATKYAPRIVPATVPDASDYTVVDATGLDPYNSILLSAYTSQIASSGATNVYASITADRVIINGGSSNTPQYIGLFDTLLASDPFPLVCTTMGTSNSSSYNANWGTVTCEPGQTAVDVANWHTAVPYLNGGPIYGATNPGGVDLYSGKSLLQRMVFGTGRSFTGLVYGYRGLFRDILLTWSQGGTGAAGDTLSYTVGATTYTYTCLMGQTYNGGPAYYVWMLQT